MSCSNSNNIAYLNGGDQGSGNNGDPGTYRILSFNEVPLQWNDGTGTSELSVSPTDTSVLRYGPGLESISFTFTNFTPRRRQYYPCNKISDTDTVVIYYRIDGSNPTGTISATAELIPDIPGNPDCFDCATNTTRSYLFNTINHTFVVNNLNPDGGEIIFYADPQELNAYNNKPCAMEFDLYTFNSIPLEVTICKKVESPGCLNLGDCGEANVTCPDGYTPECRTIETEGLVNNYRAGEFTGGIISNRAAFRHISSSRIDNQDDITPPTNYNFISGFDRLLTKAGPGKYRIKLTNLVINHEYFGISARSSEYEQIIFRVSTYTSNNVEIPLWNSGLIESNPVPDIGDICGTGIRYTVTFPVIQGFDEIFEIPEGTILNGATRIEFYVEVLAAAYILPFFCTQVEEQINFQSGTLDASYIAQEIGYACVNNIDPTITVDATVEACVGCADYGDCGEAIVQCPEGYSPECISEGDCNFYTTADSSISSINNTNTPIIIPQGISSDTCDGAITMIEPGGQTGSLTKYLINTSDDYEVVTLLAPTPQMKIQYLCVRSRIKTSMDVIFALRKEGVSTPLYEQSFTLDIPQSNYEGTGCTGTMEVLIPEWSIDLNSPLQLSLQAGDILYWDVTYDESVYSYESQTGCGGCNDFLDYKSILKLGGVIGFATNFARGNKTFICSNSAGDTVDHVSVDLECGATLVTTYLIQNCSNYREQYLITFDPGETTNLYVNQVLTLAGDSALESNCFSIVEIKEEDVRAVDISDVTVIFDYGLSNCFTCNVDITPKQIYTIRSCRDNTEIKIQMDDDSTFPVIGGFYRFSFDPDGSYEVLSVNTTDTPDETDVSILVTAPDGQNCEYFMQCGRYKGCRTGEEITINITATSPNLRFDPEDYTGFDNTSKCLNLGALYDITGSDYLEYQKWECLGPAFCDEEPVVEIAPADIEVIDLECTDCLIGNQYYKLTNCETQEEKYIYVENNTTLEPEKVYVFKEEPLVGYTAELQEQTCPDDDSDIQVYSMYDVVSIYLNCEQYTKTCYSLKDCNTNSITVTSDPEVAKYVGRIVKWVDPEDPDLVEKCALVEEFTCREQDYVDVNGLNYEECSNGFDNIIYIEKASIIDTKINEGNGSNGTPWVFDEELNCTLVFERETLELTEGGSIYGTENTIIPGIHGIPFENPNIEFINCYDECEECLFVPFDDCVTEEDLESTTVSCFTFNDLCGDNYSNLLTLSSNGTIEDNTLQSILSELKLQPYDVQNNVIYLLEYYFDTDNKCEDDIVADQSELDSRILELQIANPDEPLYSYYTNIYNLATEVLNNLTVTLGDYRTEYIEWSDNDFDNRFLPSLFKDFEFNYIDKSGLKKSSDMYKQFTFLRKTNQPLYFTNVQYLGTANYYDLMSKKIDITNGKCI